MLRLFPAAARLGVLLCLAGFARAAAPSTELGHPLVRNFTPRDYQADPLCQAVIQMGDGTIVAGNNVNLIAYDGATWRFIPLPEGAGVVRQFARAPDGTVYAGGANLLAILRAHDGTFDYVSLVDRWSAAERDALDIFQTLAHRDAVYFVGEQAIHVLRDGQLSTIPCPTPEGSRGPRVHAVGDTLYVTAPGAPLRQLTAGKLEVVSDDPFFRDNTLISVEAAAPADGPGALLLLTVDRGFFQLRADRVTPWSTPMNAVLAGKRLRRLQRASDGSAAIAFATASGNGGALFGPDGKLQSRLDESIGLANRALRDFCCDTEGGLWLGLESGLARLEWPSAVTVFDAVNGLGLGFVSDFARHEDRIYASTLEGVYRLTPGDGVAAAARFEQLFPNAAYHLHSHPAGLFAYGYNDVFLLTPAGFTSIVKTPSSMGRMRTSRRDPNRVWISTSRDLRSIYHDAAGWRDEGPVPGLDDGATPLAEDADGGIWIFPPMHGFYRISFDPAAGPVRGAPRVEHFKPGEAGLPLHTNGTAMQAGGEPLFTFNTTAQCVRFDRAQNRFVLVPGTDTLPGGWLEVGWAANDNPDPADSTVWLIKSAAPSAQRALFRLDPGRAPVALPHLIPDTTGRVWRMRVENSPESRVLWIASANGLLRLDTAAALPAPVPYSTLLHSPMPENAELPYTRVALDFAFTAPRFRPGTALEFQTRLDGFEREWSPWSAERKRTFTNLPGGRYRFEVRARDSDGVLSAPAARAFTIRPPWWATWWFIGFASVSGVGAVAGITRWFANRALQRRIALLEAQSAVERERLRLARDLHDEVGSGLGRVILFAGEAERNKADAAQLSAALNRVRASAQELVQHAREIVWAVSPQHDTLASLVERLGDYTEETLRAAGIVTRIEAPPEIPAVTLGSETRHSLFLALKESVHNCVKYSEAKSAELRFSVADGWLTISLRDEGRGFAPGEIRGTGHGTRNLARRAESLGGSAKIDSAPGAGTTVTLRVPLR